MPQVVQYFLFGFCRFAHSAAELLPHSAVEREPSKVLCVRSIKGSSTHSHANCWMNANNIDWQTTHNFHNLINAILCAKHGKSAAKHLRAQWWSSSVFVAHAKISFTEFPNTVSREEKNSRLINDVINNGQNWKIYALRGLKVSIWNAKGNTCNVMVLKLKVMPSRSCECLRINTPQPWINAIKVNIDGFPVQCRCNDNTAANTIARSALRPNCRHIRRSINDGITVGC